MTQPVSRTVEAGGFTTRYWELAPEAPDAPTVVLVHDGAFGSDAWTTWSAVMPPLAGRFRVLAPDLLGFGDTDKAVYLDRSPYVYRGAHLAAFCAAAGVGAAGAHFVGHSFGGSLVLRALAASPRALPARSGVSISGSGGPWRSRQALEDLGRFDGTEADVERLMSLMTDGYPGLAETVRLRYANTRKPGHVEACLAGRLKHPAPPEPAAPPAGRPWPEDLRDCPVPVLVVAGEADTLMEPGWTAHFEGLSATVTTRTLAGARHAPNMDRPEETAELLLDFLTEVERHAPAGAR